jgi:HAD superfamily hydrolase (TIGR01450 family)
MMCGAGYPLFAYPGAPLLPDLAKVRHVVLDMDGTLYLGETLFPHTLPFLSALSQWNIGSSFVTNNCSRSRAEYVEHLRRMGIETAPSKILTSAHATIFYVRAHLPGVNRLFVLGTAGLVEEFQAADFEIVDADPDAVIVSFDTELTYQQLARTAYWISRSLPYIATHPDRVCPTDQPIVLPDCGAICALLESATGRRPDAVPGKPSPAMLQTIFDDYELSPAEVAVIGDRLYTDIRMAREAGAIGVLTLSGETTAADVEAAAAPARPDFVVADLGEFSRMLQKARDAG